MRAIQSFIEFLSSEKGNLFLLFLLHNILLACILFGYAELLKESYFLILGALLGLIKGEYKKSV